MNPISDSESKEYDKAIRKRIALEGGTKFLKKQQRSFFENLINDPMFWAAIVCILWATVLRYTQKTKKKKLKSWTVDAVEANETIDVYMIPPGGG